MNSVFIVLKSGREIDIKNLESVSYPSKIDKTITTIKNYDNFYLYDRLLTFVGKNDIVTLKSADIEYINFYITN